MVGGGYLGVDDRIDRQFFGGGDFQQAGFLPLPPRRVVGENVHQDLGVHQNHEGLIFAVSEAHQLGGGADGVGAAAGALKGGAEGFEAMIGGGADKHAAFGRFEGHSSSGSRP